MSNNPFADKEPQSVPPRPNRRGQRGLPKRSTPENISTWERDVECVRLRKMAVDWQTITERLNYSSPGHAHSRYLWVLKEYPREDVEQMRDAEILAIELKKNQLEAKCAAGDSRSIEVWLKASERLSRLIGGDAPERKEVTVLTKDAVEQAIEKLNAEAKHLQGNIAANHPENTR